MMITLELGPIFDKTVRELGSMGQALQEAVSKGLEKGLKLATSNVIENHLTGQDLKSRTGNLRRAIDGWMEDKFAGVVGVRENSAVDAYKWILGTETKTILPKRGKFLAIPIGENLTGAGVARYTSPRQVSEGFFFKGKSGGLFFGIKHGKKGKVRPYFSLVPSVTIVGSGALAAGVLDSVDDMTGAIETEIKERMK